MAKFTNFTACVVTVILCYLLANNMIDQDIVKKSALDWLFKDILIYHMSGWYSKHVADSQL